MAMRVAPLGRCDARSFDRWPALLWLGDCSDFVDHPAHVMGCTLLRFWRRHAGHGARTRLVANHADRRLLAGAANLGYCGGSSRALARSAWHTRADDGWLDRRDAAVAGLVAGDHHPRLLPSLGGHWPCLCGGAV